MKRLILCLVAVVFLISSCSRKQSVGVKTILDATKTCKTPEEFSNYMKQFDYCFESKHERETYTFYTHFKCGQDSIGANGVRVNFAVSDDGQLNSSFLTRNENNVTRYEQELNNYNFEKIPDPDPENPRDNATWYASEKYPGLDVLWEYFFDDNKNKVWHIGFVWNKGDE